VSPPPPPAETATASIEDVIGRLRLRDDEARTTGVRRVPRMGTRLCADAAPADRSATRAQLAVDDDRPATGVDVSEASDGRACGVSRGTQTDVETRAAVAADVMYTNRANLRHTIDVQQRLFRQQLADRHAHAAAAAPPHAAGAPPPPDRHAHAAAAAPPHAAGAPPPPVRHAHASGAPPLSAAAPPPARPVAVTDTQLEWVVRRRSDGSRYVTRRSVPATCRGSADARPAGRCWSRDERRRHAADRRAAKHRAAAAAGHGRLAAELETVSRRRHAALLSVATV